MNNKLINVAIGIVIGLLISAPAIADDTEIFMTQFSGTGVSGGRPKVLIIFDNSGSMRDGVPLQRPAYDSSIDYTDPTAVDAAYPYADPAAGSGVPGEFSTDRIYWSRDGVTPDQDENDQYVAAAANECSASVTPLNTLGTYNDDLLVWRTVWGVTGTTESSSGECQFRKRTAESCETVCVSGKLDNWRDNWCVYRNWYWGHYEKQCWTGDWSNWERSSYQDGQSECVAMDGIIRNDYEYEYRWEAATTTTPIYGYVDAWESVENDDSTRNATALECQSDVESDDLLDNPHALVLEDFPASSNRTLYSGNYMAWHHNDLLIESRTKLQIAKAVVTQLVSGNSQVDFGMMVFNYNDRSGRSGGRVVKHLALMEASDRDALNVTVNGLGPDTWTPVCETYYEAYRYIAKPDSAAQSVKFGNDDRDRQPLRDFASQSGNDYDSPQYNSPMGDCENIYVVVMTDGEPTYDENANGLIKSLTGADECGIYKTGHVYDDGKKCDSYGENCDFEPNCMPELAKYLFENDLDDRWENGNQRVITYTIGFLTDQQLLRDVAEFGGGTYYTANSARALADAFQATLSEILSSNTSFAAPAVAVDAYNRTKSLNAEYIAMFRPVSRPRWPGNLKKLEMAPIAGGSDVEHVVDANGFGAIDPVTGNIKDTATTLWTTLGVDGMEVDQGGAGERLILRTVPRVLWTNTGADGALEAFDITNANLTAAHFATSDPDARNRYINWARGMDVLDEDSDSDDTDPRPWIMGDVMHSTPEAINYGKPDNTDESDESDESDVRVVFGTNAGFLHMIESDTGDESWAFFPKEIAPIVPTRYHNDSADDHPYGVDGAPAVWRYDHNGDGSIGDNADDRVYLFFGLRRGSTIGEGREAGYYALNITHPDSPVALWQIDRTDLPELGQSWSKPSPAFVPGHDGPVILIGAGYDTRKDALTTGKPDSVGRGMYIIDATDGSLVWGVTPTDDSDPNLKETELGDSVPAEVTPLDSNGDGVVDRVYFPDTGGNIWRVDLVGIDPSKWTIFKLAKLGDKTEDDDGKAVGDRRFMDRIDIALTRWTDLTYDALLLGSGNRAHPLDRTVVNRFYMLRDFDTQSALHVPRAEDCGSTDLNPEGLPCTVIPSPIEEATLFDATENLIQDGSDEQKTAARLELLSSAVDGWYITLEKTGEKSLSRSVTLQGRVFFTTFAPPDPFDANVNYVCRPSEGTGFLYAVGLHDGTAKYDWASPVDGELNKADRSKPIKDHIPDYPVTYFGEAEIGFVGVGAGTDGTGIERTGLSLSTGAIYWMQESE